MEDMSSETNIPVRWIKIQFLMFIVMNEFITDEDTVNSENSFLCFAVGVEDVRTGLAGTFSGLIYLNGFLFLWFSSLEVCASFS